MAESQRSQTRTTASTCAPETARGTHVLKIVGYSLHKGLGAGNYIRSATFTVGGYDWSIRYYPDGVWNSRFDGRVVLYLQLMSKKAKVRTLFDFRLVNQATGQATAIYYKATPVLLFNTIAAGNNKRALWGNNFSIKKLSELEASPYLRDDCLIIQCTVTVIKELWVEETAIRPEFEVQVPPSNLLDNLGKLLEGKRGADVTFKVKDELFPAHKIVLAMRSSVFDAEFYGPMAEDMTKRQYLTIEDMHPEVFRALLHFMYTDSIPSLEEFDDINSKEMVRQLLVAADRYAMERLKLICEGMLCRSLEVEDVATSLALADMHHCHNLRNACVSFVSSLNTADNAVASQEYMDLKIACPAVLSHMLDIMSKWMFSCLSLR